VVAVYETGKLLGSRIEADGTVVRRPFSGGGGAGQAMGVGAMRERVHAATMRVLREILYGRVKAEQGLRLQIWRRQGSRRYGRGRLEREQREVDSLSAEAGHARLLAGQLVARLKRGSVGMLRASMARVAKGELGMRVVLWRAACVDHAKLSLARGEAEARKLSGVQQLRLVLAYRSKGEIGMRLTHWRVRLKADAFTADEAERRQRVAQAAALTEMSPRHRDAALRSMTPEAEAALLSSMRPEERKAALSSMTPLQEAAVLAAMSPSQRAASLRGMSMEEEAATLMAMTPPQEAAALRGMNPEERKAALHAMSAQGEARALRGMRPVERLAALKQMSVEEAGSVLASMSPGDEAELLREMDPTDRAKALRAMRPDQEADVPPVLLIAHTSIYGNNH